MRFLIIFMFIFLQAEVSIVTGSKGGTYYPFGKQISELCGNVVGGLNVVSTKGSLDNIKRLLKEPDVKFAIVQYDVLLYMQEKSKNNPRVRRAINNLRIVMPLYDEQIHIVAKKNLHIRNLNELNGLRVSVGSKGSGTYITTKNIIRYAQIDFNDIVYLSLKDSLKALKNSQIDAFFYVAGVPAKMFNVSKYNYERVYNFYRKNITLLNMDNDYRVNRIYPLKKITPQDYPWLNYSVNTGAVKSVLITYNYKPNQPSYKRVKKLYQCLYNKLPLLKSSSRYHKKWKEVNPSDFSEIKWKVHPAVIEFLNNMDKPSSNKDVLDEFFEEL